jgi:hypothetical protein
MTSSNHRVARRAPRGLQRLFRGGPSRGAAVLVAALAAAGAGTLGAGCGKPPPPTTANVKAGDLPAGGDWSGVFYSPLYGHLHLVKEGSSVSGKWRTSNGDKWGELHGEATGDLLKYQWVEHKIGMVGPGSTTEGRGYFKYFVPADENANQEIKGQWGLERSEIGNPWEAVRQRNMLPDPDSVKPDETEKVNVPDEWDSDKKATPKARAKPKGDEQDGDQAPADEAK